jgi:hypothetical protein
MSCFKRVGAIAATPALAKLVVKDRFWPAWPEKALHINRKYEKPLAIFSVNILKVYYR